jgi:putative hydrolase of the HAD superfamily
MVCPARRADDLATRRAWVFDLDNTLYHPAARLFDQINARIVDFVMRALAVDHAAADRLRHDYWRTHGTTLAGLMHHHDVDPDGYLAHVHDIRIDHLEPDPALRAAIAALPGRRIVHTNGSAAHAARVLDARGLGGVFDAVYGLEHAGYRSKPAPSAFAAIHERDGINPATGVMIEDEPRNLEEPHRLGMATVHVADTADPQPHVHHHTADLAALLRQVHDGAASAPRPLHDR